MYFELTNKKINMNPIHINTRPSVLVTGASGLSGSIVINELIRRQIPVRVLSRNPQKISHLLDRADVEIYEGDMLDPDSLKGVFKGIEKALLISSSDEKMPDAQKNFIDQAKAAGLPHLIKYSGTDSGIGFNGQNFISQRWHENLEDYLVDSGLKWTIIRPSQFMQFYLPKRPTGVNLEKNALILPIGQGKLSPVDIEDVAKVCVELLTQPGHESRIYELTGPDALNMEEACGIISAVTGRVISFANISFEDYNNILLSRGVPAHSVRVLMEINKERSKCIESHIKLETHRRFGVRPTNFAEFIYKNKAAFAG
jgi:uncharacterized protein YbjT (DUF2867 family)